MSGRDDDESEKDASAEPGSSIRRARVGRRSTGRVTLTFTGPPLRLPDDVPVVDTDASQEATAAPPNGHQAREPSSPGTSGGGPSTAPQSAASPANPGSSRQREGLKREAHDGWVRDKIARGSDVYALDDVVRDPESSRPGTPSEWPVTPPRTMAPLEAEESADALGLVERRRPTESGLDLLAEMRDRFSLGDFTGALRAAELVFGRDPDHPEAHAVARASRERLEEHYTSRLGSLACVPRVIVPDADVRWLGLDHRVAYLLSRIDGAHTLEELVDASGMDRLETLKAFAQLLELRAVELQGARPSTRT